MIKSSPQPQNLDQLAKQFYLLHPTNVRRLNCLELSHTFQAFGTASWLTKHATVRDHQSSKRRCPKHVGHDGPGLLEIKPTSGHIRDGRNSAVVNNLTRQLKPGAKLYPHLALTEDDLQQTEAAFAYAAGQVAEKGNAA